MFSVHRTVSYRYLTQRWFRCLLIVASIALGVGTLVATRALNETMARAAVNATNPLAGIADLVISNGDLLVSRNLEEELAKVQGVKAVKPRIFTKVELPDLENRPVSVLGIDIVEIFKEFGDSRLSGLFTISPDTQSNYIFAALRGNPVVVGKELADDLPTKTTNIKVRRNATAKPQELIQVGVLEAHGEAEALGGYVLVLELKVAAHVLELPKNHVHRLDVTLAKDANPDQVRRDLESVLAGRAKVRTPQEQNEALQSVMYGMQTGFSLCGVAALIVGMFLVYNTLAVTVAERRHEIGILLSLGATRSQVWRLFAGEAAFLGFIGALLGVPLGYGLARIGLGPLQSVLKDVFIDVDARTVHLSWGLAWFAVALGVSTSIAAGLAPAVQAAQDNPAEAVRRMPKAATSRGLVLRAIVSGAMMLIGAALIMARSIIPARLGTYGGMMMVLVGALVASPLFAAIAARAMQPFFRRFGSIEWRLAADNLVRSPGRTGLVIGALAAGVCLVVQTSGVIRSNRVALQDWVREAIVADLIVTSGGAVSASGNQVMDEALAGELETLSFVQAALPSMRLKVDTAVQDFPRVMILSMDAKNTYEIEKERHPDSKNLEAFRLLKNQPDGAIMSENYGALHRVRVGDVVTVPGKEGPVRLRVVAAITDYNWNHGTLMVNRPLFQKKWGEAGADMIDVFLRPGTDPQAAKQQLLARFGAAYGLFCHTRTEVQEQIDRTIEKLYGIAYGQQVVVMLVATLGVLTALLISVLQRRREMGLLRAIGASRAQVIHSVLAEACLMGVIGTIIGMLVGIPIQWYVQQVIILEESGYLFPLLIPWVGALIIAAVAMAVGTLAGLGPALYAVRQRIPEAIAYE